MFVKANDLQNDMPYQVTVTAGGEEDYNKLVEETQNINGVNAVYSTTSSILFYGGDTPQDNLYTNQDVANKENLTSSYSKLFEDTCAYMNFINDEDFNALCEENGIDYHPYYSVVNGNDSQVKALLMNNVSHDNSTGKVFTDNIIGKAFYYDATDENGNVLPNSENKNIKAVVTDFVDYDADNYLCNLNGATMISLYIPLSMYISYCNNAYFSNYGEPPILQMGIETDDAEQTCDEIGKIIDQNSMSGITYINLTESLETMNTVIFVLQVFTYGFVALITLIAVANIINTVSTGIDLRRKEFAMYKSVGITPAGFNKMICLESLFYGLKALLFGIPISILISFGMYICLQSSNIPFTINILFSYSL